jgi:hypothetical protein
MLSTTSVPTKFCIIMPRHPRAIRKRLDQVIVLSYHLDRNLFPKIVSALKPGGLFICKMSLQWEANGRIASGSANPLGRNELPLLVPKLDVLYQDERPVRGRDVVEFIGTKSGDVP